jgi:hypothetical protein
MGAIDEFILRSGRKIMIEVRRGGYGGEEGGDISAA